MPDPAGSVWVTLGGSVSPTPVAQYRVTADRAEDPFIERPPLTAPAEGRETLPAPGASPEPPSLEVGPAAQGDALGHELPVPAAGGAPRPPMMRDVVDSVD